MKAERIYRLLLFVIFLAACSIAYAAGDEDVTPQLEEGRRQLQQRQWAQAEQTIAGALESSPRHAEVNALLGIARYHLGKYRLSKNNLSLALEYGTRYRARILYYLGLACNQLGEEGESVRAFQRLIAAFPDSPEAAKVRSAAARAPAPKAVGQEKKVDRFDLVLLLDASLDSNVTLTTGDESDVILSSYACAKIDLKPLPLQLKLSFLLQEYIEESEYDLMRTAAGLLTKFRPTDLDTVTPAYSFQQYWLGSNSLQGSSLFELLWEHKWSSACASSMKLSYVQKDYLGTEFEGLVGDRKDATLRAWWKIEGAGPLSRIGVQGILQDNTAEEKYLSYTFWSAALKVELALSRELLLDIEISFGEKDYARVDPDYGARRLDDFVKASASLLSEMSQDTYLELRACHLSNSSNIGTFTADRWLYSLGLLFMF